MAFVIVFLVVFSLLNIMNYLVSVQILKILQQPIERDVPISIPPQRGGWDDKVDPIRLGVADDLEPQAKSKPKRLNAEENALKQDIARAREARR